MLFLAPDGGNARTGVYQLMRLSYRGRWVRAVHSPVHVTSQTEAANCYEVTMPVVGFADLRSRDLAQGVVVWCQVAAL